MPGHPGREFCAYRANPPIAQDTHPARGLEIQCSSQALRGCLRRSAMAGFRFELAGLACRPPLPEKWDRAREEHGSIVFIVQVEFRDSSYESVQTRSTLCDRELYGPQRGSDHFKCALALDVTVYWLSAVLKTQRDRGSPGGGLPRLDRIANPPPHHDAPFRLSRAEPGRHRCWAGPDAWTKLYWGLTWPAFFPTSTKNIHVPRVPRPTVRFMQGPTSSPEIIT